MVDAAIRQGVGGEAPMILANKAFPVFLIAVLLGYHLLRGRRWKYLWLTLASWSFYAWASPGYLWVILLLTVSITSRPCELKRAPMTAPAGAG